MTAVPPAEAAENLGAVLLDDLRALRAGAAALPALEPDTYARDHAAFEKHSDQRSLIAGHLAAHLARLGEGPVSVLSVGCGDGSLDSRLAAGLLEAVPGREVTYVGIDPYVGSTTAWAAAMAALDRPELHATVHHATFADAPVTGGFDVVVFVHSMYYVADVAETVRAAHALLAEGGELLVLNAPRGALNELVDVLAPPLGGHPQWFSDDVAAGLVEADLEAGPLVTLEALVDLGGATDEVLDFAVQARLTPELQTPVRDYLDAVSVLDAVTGELRVPHPVDVFSVRRD